VIVKPPVTLCELWQHRAVIHMTELWR